MLKAVAESESCFGSRIRFFIPNLEKFTTENFFIKNPSYVFLKPYKGRSGSSNMDHLHLFLFGGLGDKFGLPGSGLVDIIESVSFPKPKHCKKRSYQVCPTKVWKIIQQCFLPTETRKLETILTRDIIWHIIRDGGVIAVTNAAALDNIPHDVAVSQQNL